MNRLQNTRLARILLLVSVGILGFASLRADAGVSIYQCYDIHGYCWYQTEEYKSTQAEALQACIDFLAAFGIVVETCHGILNPPDGLPWYEAGGWFQYPNELDYHAGHFYFGRCPKGTHEDPDLGCVPDEDDQGDQCPATVGNPINVATGNKFHRVTIPLNAELHLELSYNSNLRYGFDGTKMTHTLAPGWIHHLAAKISPIMIHGDERMVFAYRANGRMIRFTEIDGAWTPPAYIQAALERTADGWKYTTRENSVETYRNGTLDRHFARIESVSYPDGLEHALTYLGPTEEIVRVQSNFGTFVDFSYSNGRLTGLTDNSGRSWSLGYAGNNLTSITYPDETSTTFHYENTTPPEDPSEQYTLVHALTGITNARGDRVATYSYDEQRRVSSETHHVTDESGQSVAIREVSITFHPDDTRTLTNSLGDETTYEVERANGLWRIVSIDGPGCSECSNDDVAFTYDGDGHVTSMAVAGRVTRFESYDDRGQYGRLYEAYGTPEQRQIDYVYDPRFFNRPTEVLEASVSPGRQKRTEYSYTPEGRVESISVHGFTPDGEALTRTTSYEYGGPLGQISRVDGPRQDVDDSHTFTYYPETQPQVEWRNRRESVRRPEGVVEAQGIEWSATGRIVRQVVNGGLLEEIYTFDPESDRLVELERRDLSTSGPGSRTRFTYLETGHPETVTRFYGTSFARTTTQEYDEALRLTKTIDEAGNYQVYTYDAEGNRIRSEAFDVEGERKWREVSEFDAYGRQTRHTVSGSTTELTYSPEGNLESIHSGLGDPLQLSYDSLNRLTGATEFAGVGMGPLVTNSTQYHYDGADRLVALVDPNDNPTRYTYDDLGNLLGLISPDSGRAARTYDAAGNPVQTRDAEGQTVQRSFDGHNRLTTTTYSDTSLNRSFNYGEAGADPLLMTSFTDASGRTELTYNAFGSLASKHQDFSVLGLNAATTLGYRENRLEWSTDAHNRLASIVYPSGLEIAYSFDTLGQVTGLTATIQGADTPLVEQVEYLPFGGLRAFQYGNGVTYVADYDDGYRLDAYSYNGGSSPTEGFSPGSGFSRTAALGYDAGQHLTSITREDPTLSQSYQYDTLGRLVYESTRGAYQYDNNGNRERSQSPLTELPETYVYEKGTNRLSQVLPGEVVQRTYDKNGNTLTSHNGERVYVYDDANRLAEVWSGGDSPTLKAKYVYNARGERTYLVRYAANGSAHEFVYLYDHVGRLVHQSKYLNGAHKWDRETVWLADRLVAQHRVSYDGTTGLQGDSEFFFIHTDHLETPRWITDAGGGLIWSWESDAFGVMPPNKDPDGDGGSFSFIHRFPGQLYDKSTGYNYNYHRDYEPEVGRYAQSDPLGLGGGLNTFSYAEQAPTHFVDPLGLCPSEITGSAALSDWDIIGIRNREIHTNIWPPYSMTLHFDAHIIAYIDFNCVETFKCKGCPAREPRHWQTRNSRSAWANGLSWRLVDLADFWTISRAYFGFAKYAARGAALDEAVRRLLEAIGASLADEECRKSAQSGGGG